MKNYVLQLAFLVISSGMSAQNSNIQDINEWKQTISEIAIEELKNTGTPSLQIAIGYKDSIIFKQTYGMSDLQKQ